ncbi:hypothetical protein AHAS_Ahas11G0065200 [Arachis hypogaea]
MEVEGRFVNFKSWECALSLVQIIRNQNGHLLNLWYEQKSVINFTFGANGPRLDGTITAQKRMTNESPTRFVFKECVITSVSGKAELGRAYGPFAKVIIANFSLLDVVRPEGWNAWNYVGNE